MTILDQFTRQSFPVEATSGEINPPGWTHGPFGLFLDLKLDRWVLAHLPSHKVFQANFREIESACTAVLALEALPVNWHADLEDVPPVARAKVNMVLERCRGEPLPDHLSDVKRRLAELLADG